MKDFTTIWKNLANKKAITTRHMIQRSILIAMRSKNDTEAVLKHVLHKAFSPRKLSSRPYAAIEDTPADINGYYYNAVLGEKPEDILNKEELDEFNEWARCLRKPGKLIRYYSYFFTRQDIKPEYQLVQTAHAALELGATLKPEQVNNLHFTCCGITNLEELEAVEHLLTTLGIRFITFREPDIGNQKTAIAVEPIAENKRGVLRSYPLLTFNKEEPVEHIPQIILGE